MPRKQRKRYHYLYKTTCLKNGKFYYGIHSTYNLNDKYLGSGSAIRKSIWKYGKENHEKVIVEFFNSREELSKRESEIVNEDLLKNKDCLNIVLGGGNILPVPGTQGYARIYGDSSRQRKRQALGIKRMKWLRENDQAWKENYSKNQSGAQKKLVEKGIAYCLTGDSFRGKSHSDKTRKLMSETHKKNKNQQGSKNSQYGTCWVHHTTKKINKKIKKVELPSYLKEGWTQGRKIKV